MRIKICGITRREDAVDVGVQHTQRFGALRHAAEASNRGTRGAKQRVIEVGARAARNMRVDEHRDRLRYMV